MLAALSVLAAFRLRARFFRLGTTSLPMILAAVLTATGIRLVGSGLHAGHAFAGFAFILILAFRLILAMIARHVPAALGPRLGLIARHCMATAVPLFHAGCLRAARTRRRIFCLRGGTFLRSALPPRRQRESQRQYHHPHLHSDLLRVRPAPDPFIFRVSLAPNRLSVTGITSPFAPIHTPKLCVHRLFPESNGQEA